MTIATGSQALAADVIAIGFKSGMIIIWAGTIADIPSGFVICDGNNSTPNLLARFIEGVATAATEPGTTGGATAKNLTSEAQAAGSGGAGILSAGGTGKLATFVSGGASTEKYIYPAIADIRPLFYDVAFIYKT